MEDQRPSDEMSLFVHQILLRSSSSSSCTSSTLLSHSEGPLARSFSAVAPSRLRHDTYGLYGAQFVGGSANVSSSGGGAGGGGASENDNDEYDCESEEGLEALVDEVPMPVKPTPPRTSSKRSRAAEVHNLSEKRRRSRINEKMKALQNLIPNSNKTDKASMLDEAIEYLKQLQLQVQMLSIRNGISLHPMCIPGLLQPIQHSQLRMGSAEENVTQHMDMSVPLPLHQETSELTNQCSPSNCQSGQPNMSSMMINSETSFGMESSIQAYFGSYLFHTTSEGFIREDVLSNSQHYEKNPSGEASKSSFLLKARSSNLKDDNSLEGCAIGRNQTRDMLIKNTQQKYVPTQELNSISNGRRAHNGETRIGRQNLT